MAEYRWRRALQNLVLAGVLACSGAVYATQIVYDGLVTSDGYVNNADPRTLTLTGPAGWGQWSGGNTGYSYVTGTNLTFSSTPNTRGGAIQHLSTTDASRVITH